MPHLPSEAVIRAWPKPTPEQPLRVLVSGCLAGWACGVDGTTYGAMTVLAVTHRVRLAVLK